MAITNKINRSANKICGICWEAVVKNEDPDRRLFGVLPQCIHCYCLHCIRAWRQKKGVVDVRKCPECRVTSEFVCPSLYWVYTEEEKHTLIEDYKNQRLKLLFRVNSVEEIPVLPILNLAELVLASDECIM